MIRWFRGRSIRWRITAGTLVVALVVSVIAGLGLHAEFGAILHDATVKLLANDTSPIELAISKRPTDPDTHAAEDQLIAIIDPAGKAVSSNLPDYLQDRLPTIRSFHEGAREVGTDENAYLTTTEYVHTPAGVWRIVAARSLEPDALVLKQLDLVLIVGAIILFLAFGATSWLLSGAALRPVSRMRREAELLGDTRSTGVLPVGPATDELSALADTLNGLLERNRRSLDRERQMLSDASHELRTPIAVLVAQLEEASTAASRRNALATARRLSTLATNLLELSKLEQSHDTGTSAWADLARELAASTDRARILAHPTGVIVDFTLDTADADGVFAVGAASFGRLIDNLFANAITASERGTAVDARLEPSPTGLRLTVRDHGRGMPEAFIPVVLERFTRPDEARGRADGGSGLGLAIVAAIAEHAGGTVELRNREPGFEVTVELPRVPN